jgi:hypothetical protein
MKIEVLYFRGCPNHAPAVNQVRLALRSAQLEEAIQEIEVKDASMAEQLAFLGSPSIRIDGLDIEREARTAKSFGFGCRTYTDAGHRTGTPPFDLIYQALMESSQPGQTGVAL